MIGSGLSIKDDLEGAFYGMPFFNEQGKEIWTPAATLQDARGLMFLCPTCYVQNGYSNVGVHWNMCWSPDVSQDFHPNPGRWEIVGTGLEDVSLVAGSSSVLCKGDCGAHFFVTRGKIAERKLQT